MSIKNWRNDPDVLAFSPECDFAEQYKEPLDDSINQRYHRLMFAAAKQMPALQHAAVSMGCFGLIVTLFIGLLGSYRPQISHALAVPSTPTIDICGVRNPTDVEQYTGPTLPSSFSTSDPANPARASYRVIDNSPSTSFNSFEFVPAAGAHSDEFYIKTGATMAIYDASTLALNKSFTLPAPVDTGAGHFGVEPVTGNVFLATQLNGAFLYDTNGTQIWQAATPSGPLDGGRGYTYTTGGQVRYAAPVRGGGSDVWDATGAYLGKNLVSGNPKQDATTGQISTVSGGAVSIFSSDGMTLIFTMQNSSLGGFSLSSPGSVQQLDSSKFVVLDNDGLRLFDTTGQYYGTMGDDPFAHSTGNIETTITGSDIALYNGVLYYQSGMRYSVPQHLSAVSLSNFNKVIGASQSFPLGVGAGPYTSGAVSGSNYFRPGVTPSVNIVFAPWWASIGSQYTGQYTVRSAAQVKANEAGAPQPFTINGDGTTNTIIPVSLPSTDPGYYEVDVRLSKGGVVTGASCLNFSIGAPGQTVLEADRPSGEAGTITDAYNLGQKVVRGGSSLKIDAFIPNGDANSTAPMVFSSAIDATAQAISDEAARTGVVYEIQVADGSTLDKALVSNGMWQSRVQEFVNHFKPYIHDWEAWNEPNNTYSGDPVAWTNNILKPFYTAVKTADPSATVIGGGILGVSASYWTGVASVGGLDYMDAAGIHTYTGHNRSFEEQNQIGQLQAVKAVFAANGHPDMPIWDTESGYWQNGPAAFWSQGDKLIRKQVLEESIGITKLANFQNLRCYFQNSSVLWGELCNGTLSTGGLAGVQFANETNGRTFDHWLTTNIPHVYAAVYGPRAGDSGSVAVVWTDDFQMSVVPLYGLDHSTTVTDEYGKTTQLAKYSTLPISGSVTYLAIPAGDTLSVSGQESYPTANLALATSGVTTAASSATAGNPVSRINDGVADMEGHGNNTDGGVSVWFQDPTDNTPNVTLTFPNATTIDRVWVSSQGINSVQTGLRSFSVEIDSGDGTFTNVGSVSDSFFDRNHLVTFAAQTVKQIRITDLTINYSGYGNGLPPPFWSTTFSDQATIYEVEAFAPGIIYTAPVVPTPAPTPTPVNAPSSGSTTTVQPTQTQSASSGSAAATTNTAPATSTTQTTTDQNTKPTVALTQRPVEVQQAASEKPTIIADAQPHTNIRLIATVGIGIIASAGCLFAGYELRRHRHHPIMSAVSPTVYTSGG